MKVNSGYVLTGLIVLCILFMVFTTGYDAGKKTPAKVADPDVKFNDLGRNQKVDYIQGRLYYLQKNRISTGKLELQSPLDQKVELTVRIDDSSSVDELVRYLTWATGEIIALEKDLGKLRASTRPE